MEPELNHLQAPCTYVYTALKLACYCVNRNDNTTTTSSFYSYIKNNSERAMHWSIQVLIQAHKRPQVHFDATYLFISRRNLRHDKPHWWLYKRIASRNVKELQVGYLKTNGTRTTRYPIHFYTNTCVLVPFMTFYDTKPTPVEGKPSTISPNPTCKGCHSAVFCITTCDRGQE